jgi:hypothetical protein
MNKKEIMGAVILGLSAVVREQMGIDSDDFHSEVVDETESDLGLLRNQPLGSEVIQDNETSLPLILQ